MLKDRLLSLDIGEKRIGVAVSDPLGLSAIPLEYIPNDPSANEKLSNYIAEYEIKTIVIGIPLDQMGKEGTSARRIKKVVTNLRLSQEVVFWDERFSSKAAERNLIEMNVSRKNRKSKIDSKAAAFILEGYMMSLSN